MKFFITKAILLNYHDYGESNRLFTFFTYDHGKVKLDAKGARKSKRRQLTSVDLLSCLEITIRENKKSDLHILYSISMLDPFFNIRMDFRAFSAALYFADLVNSFFKENERCTPLFDDLHGFLARFDKKKFSPSDIAVFQIKLLEKAGFAPNLTTCVKCNRPVDKKGMGELDFLASKGGIICSKCNVKSIRNGVSPGTVKLLMKAKDTGVGQLDRIRFTKSALLESEKILSEFIDFQLGKRLKSYEYLKKVLSHTS